MGVPEKRAGDHDPRVDHFWRAQVGLFWRAAKLDAERLAKQGDYENAFARLDQAKDYTPTGEYPDPEIAKTRTRLRAEIRQPTAPTAPVPAPRP
jgi:hypothetical protein